MKSAVKFVANNFFFGLCLWAGLAIAPQGALAVQSVPLAWNPSNDPNVVGYRIYYGGASHYYTNSVTVGNVTNTVITGLADGVTYYFSAKAYDNAGDESDFSNEASISSTSVSANGAIFMASSSLDNSSGRYSFSLASGAPAGVSINPATGYISWAPGLANASTTNYIKVVVADSQNPGTSSVQTLVIAVGDYLEVNLNSAVVQAGQSVTMPIEIYSSAGATNLAFEFTYLGHHFSNASLAANNSGMTKSMYNQGTNFVLRIGNMQLTPGTNVVAQLTLWATAGQTSSFVPLTLLSPQAIKPDGTAYQNVVCDPAQVTIVGANPLIAPLTVSTNSRSLTVYGNPQSNYAVQYTKDLSATWQPLVSFIQTNLVQTVILPDDSPVAFYRLAQQ